MYTTLARMQAELKGTQPNATTASEQQLMMYARTVTDRIRAFKFEFEPLFYTRKITPYGQNVNTFLGTLNLGDMLLEPTAIAIGSLTPSYGTDVIAFPDNGMFPIRVLRIASPGSGPFPSWFSCCVGCNSFLESIAVTGFWGMREFYLSSGFFDSGQDVPVAGLTATAATMVITDVDGLDPYNRTPLFSAGNLVRIDDELIDIVKTDTATNTLTMIRGVRGTTAAAHVAGTAIQIWECEDDIVNAATRQACLLYARRGAYQQVTTYPDGVSVSYPSDLLAELRATVQRFNYVGNY